MTTSYVLMTALPVTKGHELLIEFAAQLTGRVEVILCTQPDEPFAHERSDALDKIVGTLPGVHLNRIHKVLPQEPEGHEGFWDMWKGFLDMFGFEPGDYIVGSEHYGVKLAEIAGGRFMPYDIDREIYWSKATHVREHTFHGFNEISRSFQHHVRPTVTIFGAESTGKTTLTKALSHALNGHFLFEWARPYLEAVGTTVDERAMTEIWEGQRALQDHARNLYDKPFVFQDTDLWSTVGYWDLAPWDKVDKSPYDLRADASERYSDLYLITQSNIPFEPDPLRYGGDQREITDKDWIEFADSWSLPYVVLQSDDRKGRLEEATAYCMSLFNNKAAGLSYHRQGKEYANV
jgi:HTH-type transcriptional repressor of NAD biosynthesis genes